MSPENSTTQELFGYMMGESTRWTWDILFVIGCIAGEITVLI